MTYCYFNKKIIPFEKAMVHIDDIGLLRAYGIFDFLITCNKKPFLIKEHLKRLRHSAEVLNLKVPVSDAELVKIFKKLIKKNKFKEMSFRIVLTGGRTKDGIIFNPSSPTFFVLAGNLQKPGLKCYENGVKIITSNFKREIPEAKTLDYIFATRIHNARLKKEKALEILYVFNNSVLECSTSNFFIFKGNTLITPKDDILRGVTRNFVINLAKGHFKIEERKISAKELKSATEAFLSASNKDIVPVVKVDNLKIGNGKVGENTKKVMKMFNNYAKNY